jgi:hypothetical protein
MNERKERKGFLVPHEENKKTEKRKTEDKN